MCFAQLFIMIGFPESKRFNSRQYFVHATACWANDFSKSAKRLAQEILQQQENVNKNSVQIFQN